LSEYDLHVQVASMLKNFGREDTIWFHPPNGGQRHIAVASKLKRMGTRAGVSDFVLYVDRQLHFLELKDGKGSLSPSQKEWGALVRRCGAGFHVAKSYDEALKILQDIGALRIRIT
jgi:hypothetical protein